MPTDARAAHGDKKNSRNHENLTAARPDSTAESVRLSRKNSATAYARERKKRVKRRNIILGACATFVVALVSVGVAMAVYASGINEQFKTNLNGVVVDFTVDIWQEVLVEPETPEAPFWMLLLGSDGYSWSNEVARTDVIILVHVDQPNKRAAMISIPRDLYVSIPGYWSDKINAAYVWGEIYGAEGGVPVIIKTVSEFAGVDISYFAMVSFDKFGELVDALGGVEVDVPVDIDDIEAGDDKISKGLQTLNGSQALTFVRSRKFAIGDYQRAANQRTFLQALAKKVLSDPANIRKSVNQIADMTFTNMDLQRIVKVAFALQGMQENDIYTYHVPSYTGTVMYDGDFPVSVVFAYDSEWKKLIGAINSGNYPPPQTDSFVGKIPEGYIAVEKPVEEKPTDEPTTILTSDYRVSIMNGSGIEGSATSVKDRLWLVGYRIGEVGDMDNYDYDTTLIIYKDAAHWAAAENIRLRLGYGWLVVNNGRYEFEGDILVIVGGDYDG